MNDFIGKIDWKLLRKQKDILWFWICDPITCKLSEPEKNAVDGILNLLDNLQDYAVDDLGLDKLKVFGKID